MLIIPPVDSVYSLSNDLQRTATKTLGLVKPSAHSRAKSYVRNMTTLMVLVDNATQTLRGYTRNKKTKPTSADLDTAVARLREFERHFKAILNRIETNATRNAHLFRKKTTSEFSRPATSWRVESKMLEKSIARYSKAVMALEHKLATIRVGGRTNVPNGPTPSKARPAPGRR